MSKSSSVTDCKSAQQISFTCPALALRLEATESNLLQFHAGTEGASMLIPLRHENMQGRRWPVITIGLIALNVLIFLGTHWQMDREGPDLVEVKTHVLLLAAMRPELKIEGRAQEFITDVQTKNPRLWKEAQNPNRQVLDAWDARMRMM